MRYLSLFTAVLFTISAHAQTASSGSANANSDVQTASRTEQAVGSTSSQASAAVQNGSTSTSAAQATNLSAELTKKIDTKNARIGDDVVARTTNAAKLSDGTKLPKGTQLLGKVMDVQAKSAEEKASRLAFTFDRVLLRNGNQLPIRATVMSLTAPVSATAMADSEGSMSGGAGPAPVMASGGSRASGGLLGGGATGAVGGIARGTGSLVGNTSSGITSTTSNTLHTVANAGSATANGAGSAATNVTGQVTNLQGVSFNSDSSASQSTVLNAQGRNFSLASGTQMTLSISASNQR